MSRVLATVIASVAAFASSNGVATTVRSTDQIVIGAGERIEIVDATSGRARRLALGGDPSWSPDGRTIAFVCRRPPAPFTEVCVVETTSGRVRQLTDDDVQERHPVWSPDGTRIAFAQMQPPLNPTVLFEDVLVMRVDATDARRLTRDGLVKESLAWSPDGSRLVFMEYRFLRTRVSVVNADGSGERLIADEADEPSWSPGGRKLAYLAYVPVDGYAVPVLRVARADGTDANVIVRGTRNLPISGLSWSPDSREIAYTGRVHIKLVDVKTRRAHVLTHGQHVSDRFPSWSPDSRRIAFVRYVPRSRRYELLVVNRDGTRPRVLLRSRSELFAPRWRPPH